MPVTGAHQELPLASGAATDSLQVIPAPESVRLCRRMFSIEKNVAATLLFGRAVGVQTRHARKTSLGSNAGEPASPTDAPCHTAHCSGAALWSFTPGGKCVGEGVFTANRYLRMETHCCSYPKRFFGSASSRGFRHEPIRLDSAHDEPQASAGSLSVGRQCWP